MFNEKLIHARFDLPKADATDGYGPGHPLRNEKTHERLLEYLTSRLILGKEQRDNRILRYGQIDRDVAAFMRLDEDDKKRAIEHQITGVPKATKVSLPLMYIHLDDIMTFYAQTFAPNRGMFYHSSGPEDSEVSTQLVAVMNNHAILGGYYRQLLRSIWAILKYNVGGITVSWDTEYGPKLQAETGGSTTLTNQVVFQGNRIKALDMYNFFHDPAVEPQDLYKEGEWFATVELMSHYGLKSRALEGRYMNCQELLDDPVNHSDLTKYYKHPPQESRLDTDETAAKNFNWFSFMTGSDMRVLNGAFEITKIYCRINPNDFGLIPGKAADRAARNRYEVWRFTIVNGEHIVETEYMKNIHGHLPVYLGVLNDDNMGEAAKSVAEILNPLQQFSSFLLNTHVLASRKNLYGITYYNPSCLDMEGIPEGEVAARIPLKPQGWDKDIRQIIMHDDNVLDTKQTLEDLQGMMQLVDQFFPTQSLPSQIASIDRAVDSQVAAVQQGANRRQHKGARLIDETMLRPMRFCMFYNIVQFQKDGEEVQDFATGKGTKIDLTKLRDMNLATVIGQGLKALDRQLIQSQIRDVIFAMIQAPQVAQRIDILGLLDYWSSMMDIETNLKQFELPPPPAAGGVPGVDAAGNPIQPATSPETVAGGPIYGDE